MIYSAKQWVRVKLRLETAGPVAVSTRQDVVPALSGKGIILEDREVEFELDVGERVFYTAESVNRVRVIIERLAFDRNDVGPIAEEELDSGAGPGGC